MAKNRRELDHQRDIYHARRAANMCIDCGAPTNGYISCDACRKRARQGEADRASRREKCVVHGTICAEGFCQGCARVALEYEREASRIARENGVCPICLIRPESGRACAECYASGALVHEAGDWDYGEAASLRAAGWCPVCCGIPSRAAQPHCHYCHTMWEPIETAIGALFGCSLADADSISDSLDRADPITRTKVCACGGPKSLAAETCRQCAKDARKKRSAADIARRRLCACGAVAAPRGSCCEQCIAAKKKARDEARVRINETPCVTCGRLGVPRGGRQCVVCRAHAKETCVDCGAKKGPQKTRCEACYTRNLKAVRGAHSKAVWAAISAERKAASRCQRCGASPLPHGCSKYCSECKVIARKEQAIERRRARKKPKPGCIDCGATRAPRRERCELCHMKHVFLIENERHAKAMEREQLKTTCRRCGGPKQLEATWYCRECGVTVALERRAARHRARKAAANAV